MYIWNLQTGKRMQLSQEWDVGVLRVMVNDGQVKQRLKAVVDSGAAAHAMPQYAVPQH